MRDLIGLKVKMDRPVDRDRPRCRNVCIIGAGKGPHAAARIAINIVAGCRNQLAMD